MVRPPNEIAPQQRAFTRQAHNICITSVALASQYLLKTPGRCRRGLGGITVV